MVPLLPVKSSMLSHVGYDPVSRTLAARFNASNYVHHYQDVPQDVFNAIQAAPSIGKAFNEHVRGKYETTVAAVDEDQSADAEV